MVDTIYTLKEPINEDINNLQTSYVKNKWLFNKVPASEYDSLWNFGLPMNSNNEITLEIEEGKYHLFDKETKKRLN